MIPLAMPTTYTPLLPTPRSAGHWASTGQIRLTTILILCFLAARASTALAQDDLVLSNDTWVLTLAKNSGAIVSVMDKSAGNRKVIEGQFAAWMCNVGSASSTQPVAASAPNKADFTYTLAGMTVILHYLCVGDRIDIWADVTNRSSGTIRSFACPGALLLPNDGKGTGVFPADWGRAITPGTHASIETPCTADFLHFDLTEGKVALFSVQPMRDRVRYDRNPPYYLTARLSTGPVGNDHLSMEHSWNCWVPDGQSWTSPVMRIEIGHDYIKSLKNYGAANQYTRTLKDKMKPEVLARFRRAICSETSVENLLNTGVDDVVFYNDFVDHIPHGFDHGYPQWLPSPAEGNLAPSFVQRYERGHSGGHLLGLYGNFTFWGKSCDFLNEAALQRDEAGHIVPCGYGDCVGRSCFWHPDLRNKCFPQIDVERDKYQMDLVFTDQVSAEYGGYDFNPACPNPAASFQGMIYCARDAANRLPLQVEAWDRGQWDAHLNAVSLYMCRQLSSEWGDIIPITQIFGHHLASYEWKMNKINQTVDNQNKLTACLVFGGRPQYHLPGNTVWLEWLNACTRTVVSIVTDKEMTDFRHLNVSGGGLVIQSKYQDITIIANFSGKPYDYSPQVTIASDGFYAFGPNLEAGVTDRYKENATAGYKFANLNNERFYPLPAAPPQKFAALPRLAGPMSACLKVRQASLGLIDIVKDYIRQDLASHLY